MYDNHDNPNGLPGSGAGQPAGQPDGQPAGQPTSQPARRPDDFLLTDTAQPATAQLPPAGQQCPYAAYAPYEALPPDLGLTPISRNTRIVIGVVLAVLALLIAIPLAAWASSPDTYTGIIATLDAKKDNVTALTATTAGASTAITLIPGDIGTPIAEQIASLSSDLLIILSILYLEKFLLTTLGLVALRIIVPLGLVCWILALVAEYRPGLRNGLFKVGLKMVAFGVAMALLIPASVWASDTIDRTFEESINASNAAAVTATGQLQETMELEESDSGGSDGGFIQGIVSTVQGAVSSIGTNVEQITDDLHNALGSLIDSIAIMIVTSCLVPIVMLLLFLWIVRAITGIDVQLPVLAARKRLQGAGRSAIRHLGGK